MCQIIHNLKFVHCNRFTVLQSTPDDAKALHCKIVCWIQLSNFKDALNLINNSKYQQIVSNFVFEKAYVQYRLNMLKDALQTVESVTEITPPLKELKYLTYVCLQLTCNCALYYIDLFSGLKSFID